MIVKFFALPSENPAHKTQLKVAFTAGTPANYAGLDWNVGRSQFRRDHINSNYRLVDVRIKVIKRRAHVVHTFVMERHRNEYLANSRLRGAA